MTVLPDPKPTATAAGQTANPLTDAIINAAVDHAIQEARRLDTTPQATIGNTPPVPQPDARIAPRWAVGIAVASIGVGAGSTGLGCAAWLALKGLAMVSVPGLERFALVIIAPFAGAAMVLTAAGVAIGKARTAVTTIHNHGPVHQEQRNVQSKNVGLWARTSNEG
ncbi:hypothetical protein [Streptomyces sp. NPDC093223]|uniref:hypothetical protein n=1 Tax=Streptomyces sp. NPDC093223 TaxID=3366033 RepID=UPI00381E7FE1